jgi:ADP-heptose:LPS heptosyltransferase
MVSGRDAIRYEAEGGLGDHLLQAAACLEFKTKFPGKWVGLMVKRQYESILQRVEGLDKIGADLTLNRIPAGALYVSGKTEYMSDPRGLGYGKQSLYGTHLGLESVRRLARIQISDNIVTAGKEFLKTYQWEEKRPLIGIQFASASGWAKSWPLRHVRDLVKLIYAETEGEAVIFGRNWEYPVDSPLGMNLTGPLTWETTLEVLSLCRAVVCVDSGILHLSRAIGKKYACLWGGSTPEYILGERLGAYDVQLEMDCKNRLCMECPKKRPLCMENLTPDLVIEKIKAMIQEGGAEENG